MNTEAQKLELIEWLLKLNDPHALKKVMKLKNAHPYPKRGSRKFGSGKGIFTYIADDFDAPLPDFKDYMK